MRTMLLLALTVLTVPGLTRANPYSEGMAARDRKDWPTCARLLEASAVRTVKNLVDGRESSRRYQLAADCAALGGNRDDAFRLLGLAAERGLRDPKIFATDVDLASLRDDPRWPGAMAAARQNEQAFLKTVGDPALRAEIVAMADEDQASRLRTMPPNKATAEDWAAINAADERRTARMKEIVKAHGWPGKSLVGEDAARRAWLLVQHADRDVAFQKECLVLLEKAVKTGDATGLELAYLTDRVAGAEDRKQVYGTQFGDGEPLPIEDEAHVDDRRKAVGLPPLAEYRKEMQEAFGTPDQIRVDRVKWYVGAYLGKWDAKDRESIVAMTAPDADGVFVTADGHQPWVGFPTMTPEVDEVLRSFDTRKSTFRDLRVKLLGGGKVAVATFLLDTEGVAGGKPFSRSGVRVTWVLEDRERRWFLVSAHASLPVVGTR